MEGADPQEIHVEVALNVSGSRGPVIFWQHLG
jgi:hypothetical protein